MTSEPRGPEYDRLPDGGFANLVVATILDPDSGEIRYQAALAAATGRELAAAARLLPLEVAAWRAAQDQRRARMAELRRRYPGIEDSA